MADNVALTAMSGGSTIATDEVGAAHYQRIKLAHGEDGVASDVRHASPLPVARAGVAAPLSRFLDTVGNGTGTKSATGDYSLGAQDFLIAPGAGQVYSIQRLVVAIEDGAAIADGGVYGALGAALTNGILVAVKDASLTLFDLTDGVPITTNHAWLARCASRVDGFGTGNGLLVVTWDFAAAGAQLRLVGDDGEKLVVTLEDDFSGLVSHTFVAQGFSE